MLFHSAILTRHQTAVINVVGLTPALLGEHTPYLSSFSRAGGQVPIRTVLPAVTCSVQSTFLTGLLPSQHGIVANGWYFRDLARVWFWRQSNQLVGGEKVWETARRRDTEVTCANLFWWYNMYSSADFSVTPRPIYPADGRKIPDIYTHPPELRDRLNAEIGEFPFFHFWGPQADIRSSEWIAEAAVRVLEWHRPTLLLVYLPHLDYNLQRLGPRHPDLGRDLEQIDRVCGRLLVRLREKKVRILVLSEYGITPVQGPIHINRLLRRQGWLRVREEMGRETLDAGACQVFAVADHQVAHIYVREPGKIPQVKSFLEEIPGIERVLDASGKKEFGLDHARAGELVAIARSDRWFTYYYWLEERRAPDFARTVDIHRKPGYDPAELFVDPQIRFPAIKVGWTLLKKKLGFRYLLQVIPLQASLVKGSHGRIPDDLRQSPLLITSEPRLLEKRSGSGASPLPASEVRDLILDHLFTD